MMKQLEALKDITALLGSVAPPAAIAFMAIYKLVPPFEIGGRALLTSCLLYFFLSYILTARSMRANGTGASSKSADHERFMTMHKEVYSDSTKISPAPSAKLTVDFKKDGADKEIAIVIIGTALSPAATLRCLFTKGFWEIANTLAMMPVMLKELKDDPDSGLLHYEPYSPSFMSFLAGKPSLTVQYWRSRQHVLNFSKNRDMTHRPTMAKFAQTMLKIYRQSKGTEFISPLAIYHEMYTLPTNEVECIFNSAPKNFGLMAAFPNCVVPITKDLKNMSALDRLKKE